MTGTSAPEMLVSALAALQGNPGLALGNNAYGSNIANIALVLGITALAILQLLDGYLSRMDALLLLAVFAVLMIWTIFLGMRGNGDMLVAELEQEMPDRVMPLKSAYLAYLVHTYLAPTVSA